MIDQPASHHRGRAVSLLLMSETLGLLLGSTAGGWVYGRVGITSPLLVKAACTLGATVAIGWGGLPSEIPPVARPRGLCDGPRLGTVLRTPGVPLMSLTNAVLFAIQTGVLVSLYPLVLAEQGGLSPEAVGSLISLSGLGQLLALGLGGIAADRWGRRRVLIPGRLLSGALRGSVALVTDSVVLGLWSVAIGWLRTVTDSGMVVGPLVMGGPADAVHLAAPFLLAAALLGMLVWQCRHQAVEPSGTVQVSVRYTGNRRENDEAL